MNTQDYQKEYKQTYKLKNKVVSFPLTTTFYDDLNRKWIYLNLTTNSFAKKIVTAFLQNTSINILSQEKKEFINEYMRISRWISNNINQIAHKTNIEKDIDIRILVNSLMQYETEFKNFITKF